MSGKGLTLCCLVLLLELKLRAGRERPHPTRRWQSGSERPAHSGGMAGRSRPSLALLASGALLLVV